MRRLSQKIVRWFEQNARDLPWRRTRDPYAIWISEIMLQQTQVKTVIPYYERWMESLPTIQDFAKARTERVLKLWEGLGYYRRVRLAQSAARLIVEKCEGRFPKSFDDVLALPGVGRYTAGAICSIAFDQPTPILDGNVIRVLSRLLGIAGDPRAKPVNAQLWRAAEKLAVASGRPSQFNQGMMELGALICLPRQPKCTICPLRKECFALREGQVEELPTPTQRVAATQRRFIALVVRDGKRLLVRRRPTGVVNGGLWEFPNVEVEVNAKNVRALVVPFEIDGALPFFGVRHSITRYRVTLEAYHAKLSTSSLNGDSKSVWKTPTELEKLPFTSAHRKVMLRATEDQ